MYPTKESLQSFTLKAIRRVHVHGNTVYVTFEDGSVRQQKFDVRLRIFLTAMQHLYVKKTDDSSDCRRCSLGLYAFLGYNVGDTVVFYDRRNTEKLPIVFS